MWSGGRGAVEGVEAAEGRESRGDAVRGSDIWFLTDETAGGQEVTGGDGDAVLVVKDAARAIGAEELNRVGGAAGEGTRECGVNVHGGDGERISGSSVAGDVAGGVDAQAAADGVNVEKA